MEQQHDTAKILRRARALPARLRVEVLAEAMRVASEEEREAIAGLLIELAAPAAPTGWMRVRARLPRLVQEALGDAAEEVRDRAIGAIAGGWEMVPPALRPVAAAAATDGSVGSGVGTTVDGASRFERVVPAIVTSEEPQVRCSVARLVADLRLPGLMPLLGTLAADPEARVRRAAVESLLRLSLMSAAAELAERGVEIGSVVADGPLAEAARGGAEDAPVPGPLCRAIAQAIHGQEGRGSPGTRRDLMVAAILAGRSGRDAEAGRLILRAVRAEREGTGSEDATLGLLRSTLRTTAAPLAAVRAVEWLSAPGLHRTCSDRLLAPRSATDIELAAGASHLLLRPARARRERSGSVRSAGRALAGVARMGLAARLGAVRMVDWMGVTPEGREAALTPLLTDTSAMVRHGLARGAGGGLLGDVLFDHEERVARHAFLRWSMAGTGLSRMAMATPGGQSRGATLSRLARSAHASVRAFAADEREMTVAPGGLQERLTLRRMMVASPGTTLDGLRERLAGADLAECERCVGLVRGMGLGEVLSESLLGLLGRVREMGEPAARRLTASLATTLGEIPALVALDAATELIGHEDARVGANAVEALARLSRAGGGEVAAGGREVVAPLVELKSDPRHRVRANALRAMIEEGGERNVAMEALAAMLEDDRVGHRLASSWVLWRMLPEMARRGGASGVGSSGWPVLAARAVRLASFDPDDRVRRRAAACVSRLSVATGGAWSAGT